LQILSQKEKSELNNLIYEYDYRWSLHARDKQRIPKGDWVYWLVKAGRGFGKTRTGAETVRIWKDHFPIINLVASTAADVRDFMVEGESGILNISPKWDRPNYEPSKKKLTWPNGSIGKLYTADEPDTLRGAQCYKAWADELAKWRYDDAWIQLKMGLRLGDNPQCIITTTPRPTKIIKELAKDKHTHVTHGTSYENRENLAAAFYDEIIKMYEGTRIGRQELNAEILEDVEGALWTNKLIELSHIPGIPKEFKRIGIAVDPAVTSNPDSDETGIIIGGLGIDNKAYILDDFTGIYTPRQWAERTIYNYQKYNADKVIAEVNQGGDLVRTNLQIIDKNIEPLMIRAYRGKALRAEPIVGLYEQGRVKHVGSLPKLEDEMTGWDAKGGSKSPNRIDALVYLVCYLMDLDPNTGKNNYSFI